jgi:hypothetical protein
MRLYHLSVLFLLACSGPDNSPADASSDAAKEASLDAAKDVTIDAPPDTGTTDGGADADDGASDATDDAAQDASDDAVQDASDDAVQDASDDAVQDAADDVVQDASDDADTDAGLDGGSVDASDGGACDAGTNCNCLDDTSSSITMYESAGTPPTAAGGTIVPGLYYLTSDVYYDGNTTSDGLVSETMQIDGNGNAALTSLVGYVTKEMDTYTINGTSFTLTMTCPTSYVTAFDYTATSTMLTLILDDGYGNKLVLEYTKQ